MPEEKDNEKAEAYARYDAIKKFAGEEIEKLSEGLSSKLLKVYVQWQEEGEKDNLGTRIYDVAKEYIIKERLKGDPKKYSFEETEDLERKVIVPYIGMTKTQLERAYTNLKEAKKRLSFDRFIGNFKEPICKVFGDELNKIFFYRIEKISDGEWKYLRSYVIEYAKQLGLELDEKRIVSPVSAKRALGFIILNGLVLEKQRENMESKLNNLMEIGEGDIEAEEG